MKWVAVISILVPVHRSYSSKIVAAISKIWWGQPGDAVTFVASISERHRALVGDAVSLYMTKLEYNWLAVQLYMEILLWVS